jgi:hypothetical protein
MAIGLTTFEFMGVFLAKLESGEIHTENITQSLELLSQDVSFSEDSFTLLEATCRSYVATLEKKEIQSSEKLYVIFIGKILVDVRVNSNDKVVLKKWGPE